MCELCAMVGPDVAKEVNGFECAAPGGGPEGDLAAITETGDAPANTSTSYSMSAGDTFSGSLGFAGDRDWVQITVTGGTAVQISMNGVSLGDPYLRLYDSSGSYISYNDDIDTSGGNYNSSLWLQVAETTTFYVAAGSYNDTGSGTYQLTATARTPLSTFNNDQIAQYLTNGYWTDTGRSQRSFNVGGDNAIDVNITALTADGQFLATNALLAWANVTGITFNFVTSGGEILFDDNGSGASNSSTTSGNAILESRVNISTSWLANSGTTIDSYSFQTYIHEIGHALGLGHGGNYNSSATYGLDTHYANDSWQATVMSYFDQTENTSITASRAYIVTPMIADIVAIQNLYGTPTTIRTGNTTYGENSTAGGYLDTLLSASTNPIALTVHDNGGFDTLDFGTQTAAQLIDLRPESISNVGGLIGNLSIARGTIIENAIGGSGNDTIHGNSTHNLIYGNGGSDWAVIHAAQSSITGTYRFAEAVVFATSQGNDVLFDIENVQFNDGTVSGAVSASDWSILMYAASHVDLLTGLGTNQHELFLHFANYGIAEGRQITFDAWGYLASNLDLIGSVGASANAAASHYVTTGYGEGRQITFNALEYIASYGDLIGVFGANSSGGAQHYVESGYAEGRHITFNALEYIASNSDLASILGANALEGVRHYINHGFGEGRTSSFDARLYLGAYDDLRAIFGQNLDGATTHFIQIGAAEGRSGNAFNALEYIASYTDLISGIGASAEGGIAHFLEYGFNEGRTISFDGLAYIASYGDLISALGTNASAGAGHYVMHGFGEGRTTTFDPLAYINAASNSDLLPAFSNNLVGATIHYIQYGFNEGRATSAEEPVVKMAELDEDDAFVFDGIDMADSGMDGADQPDDPFFFDADAGDKPADPFDGQLDTDFDFAAIPNVLELGPGDFAHI
ncbi:M10 family metallopeptidase C-terminal domain-containing protein [Stappia sp.]|uniref:M10 family metallopeptidase C-terminal domain-containing protein n=1 Tax=Stappia sp. TaxID=1870903 RepID=UPI003D10D63C